MCGGSEDTVRRFTPGLVCDFCVTAYRFLDSTRSGLLGHLAITSGSTPLAMAIIRGDVELCRLALESGADPYIENGLGMNAFEICEKSGPFPSVMKALKEYGKKK